MVLIFLSSFAIILLGKGKRVALIQLFSYCDMQLLLSVSYSQCHLQCVIVAFICHAHLRFDIVLT